MKNKRNLYGVIKYMILLMTIILIMISITACKRSVKDKTITFQSNIGEITGEYTGTLVDGEPSESGTLCIYDTDGDLYQKFKLNGKNVVNGEFYYQKLKHRQIFYEAGAAKRGKWFDKKGNVIWESQITEKGWPELIVKDGNDNFSNASDTTKFTKSNLWKFYAGFCDISYASVSEDGLILYDAYITDISGNRDYNEVTFLYRPTDDEPRYGMNDIIMWKGQLVSVDGNNPVIEAHEFDLMIKNR